MKQLFELGRIVATPGVLSELTRAEVATCIERHSRGDWGELEKADIRENELSLREGFRILSNYRVRDIKVWVITEADRSSTCILLPSEY